MTFELSTRDFRGFHDQDFVPIRPITLLVGENSAGKSSFLAALKYMRDFLSTEVEPSFNEDPFQLGTYDQIAHFRGGKSGRAREFAISARQQVNLRRTRYSDLSGRFLVEVSLHFKKIDSHAAPVRGRIATGDYCLEASAEGDGTQLFFIDSDGQRRAASSALRMPPVAKSDFVKYWPFLIRDLRYRLRSSITSEPTLFDDDLPHLSRITELAESVFRRATDLSEATSAIRTRPQRTYTPGTERRDGEGSHVPYEIAKRFRAEERAKDEWPTLKKTIDAFGKNSGMFHEIYVKSFGRTASDPFQIQFSSGGPRMNLVDLGYGTSQILPILYSIATAKRGSYYLIQQPEVHLHPQAQAALGTLFVDAQISTGLNFVIETHSDFIVDRIRSAVARGEYSREDVSLLFFERGRLENRIYHIELGESGEPLNPPQSYRDFFIGEQMRALGF